MNNWFMVFLGGVRGAGVNLSTSLLRGHFSLGKHVILFCNEERDNGNTRLYMRSFCLNHGETRIGHLPSIIRRNNTILASGV
jgi:hypothetical protein